MTKNMNRHYRHNNHESNFNWLRTLVRLYNILTSPKIKEV